MSYCLFDHFPVTPASSPFRCLSSDLVSTALCPASRTSHRRTYSTRLNGTPARKAAGAGMVNPIILRHLGFLRASAMFRTHGQDSVPPGPLNGNNRRTPSKWPPGDLPRCCSRALRPNSHGVGSVGSIDHCFELPLDSKERRNADPSSPAPMFFLRVAFPEAPASEEGH